MVLASGTSSGHHWMAGGEVSPQAQATEFGENDPDPIRGYNDRVCRSGSINLGVNQTFSRPPPVCGPAAAWQLIVSGSSFLIGYRGFGHGGLLVFLGCLFSLVAQGSGGRWFWQLMVQVGFVDSRSSSPEGKEARAGVGSRRMFRVAWRAGLGSGRPGLECWWYVPFCGGCWPGCRGPVAAAVCFVFFASLVLPRSPYAVSGSSVSFPGGRWYVPGVQFEIRAP